MKNLATKREKLEALDTAVLDAMIDLVAKEDYDELSNLSGVITYLKNNQVLTPPKPDQGVGEDIKDILAK